MGHLVRFETPNGSAVWVNPGCVHSLSEDTETSSVIETGGYYHKVSGTVDQVAEQLGEDIEEEP